MTKRSLTTAVTRALKRACIEYEIVETTNDSSSIDFTFEPGNAELAMRAITVASDYVLLFIPAEIAIPEDRLYGVVSWVLEVNAEQAAATFLVDVDARTLTLRQSIDCRALPAAVLDDVLPLAWTSLVKVWRDYAPALLRIIAGQDDSDDSVESAWNEAVTSLADAMCRSVASYCGEQVAEAMAGALENVAEEYLERVGESGVDSIGDVQVSVEGSDQATVLSIETEEVGALRYRFSPEAIRARAESDAQGLTLYYNTEPSTVARVLNQGFVNEPVSTRDYGQDEAGFPVTEGDERVSDAVLLTSGPLGLDDRGARTGLIRIEWNADAPNLLEYEQARTAYEGSEAFPVERPIREWYVPAEVINQAVREELAVVSVVS